MVIDCILLIYIPIQPQCIKYIQPCLIDTVFALVYLVKANFNVVSTLEYRNLKFDISMQPLCRNSYFNVEIDREIGSVLFAISTH